MIKGFSVAETPASTHETPQPENWTDEITELEKYFETATIPPPPIKLNQCSTITNASLFIRSQLDYLKANNGNRTFLPYLERLQELRTLIEMGK